MRLLKQLGKLVFWFALWAIIPAVAMYPIALWAATHTRVSSYAIAQGYALAVAILFFPTGFLVDYAYRYFINPYGSSPMAQDFGLKTDSGPRATETWWASRRLRYNVGLLIAGPLGFGLYAVAVSRCIDVRAPGHWEITVLTTLFQGFAYLVMIGAANLCYYLGPWSERLVRPANVAGYRKIVFWLGFSFSVLLPLAPSALLFVTCALHAGQEQSVIL